MRNSDCLTTRDLRRRGWTEQLVRRFAGPADHLAVNPHHPGGAAMRLYRSERIAEVEATAEFIEAKTAAERRQEAARKALATKSSNAAASAAQVIAPPVLPPAPRDELIAMAVRWYNSTETWRSGAGRWISTSDPDAVLFPVVIDFIQDRLRDYRQRARPIGLPVDQATAAVDRKVLDAIAARFPWLAAACERQGSGKSAEPIGARNDSLPDRADPTRRGVSDHAL